MRHAALLSALLIVLAGCGGVISDPAAEPTATAPSTTTPDTDITVIGPELPFDAETVFERVANLTGERVDAPVIYVEPPEERSVSPFDDRRSGFRAALGITPRDPNDTLEFAAYVPSDGNSVVVNENILDDESGTEATLAHEFVHTVQTQRGWTDSLWVVDQEVPGGMNYDDRLTYRLVVEGAATYTERHYVQQYLPELAGERSLRAEYRNGSAYERLNYGPYVLGSSYVAERIDSPRELKRVHRHPPDSTEQVLHNSTDPVETVTVTTTEMHNWTERERDRQGELFLRIALRTELNKSTAVDAAHGWGEDRRITFRKQNDTATAWVLHWDDAANATEFESAFDRYLDAKATRNGSVWEQDDGNATYRVVEANDETTVVFLGNESFVRTATVNASVETQFDIEVAG